MQQSLTWVVQGDPGAVSVADLVMDPDKRPSGPGDQRTGFQCTPVVGGLVLAALGQPITGG